MDLNSLFKIDEQPIKNIYDVMAICYTSLTEELKNKGITEFDFLASYIDKIGKPVDTDKESDEFQRALLLEAITDSSIFLQEWIRNIPFLSTPLGTSQLTKTLPEKLALVEKKLVSCLSKEAPLFAIELYILLLACDNYAQIDSSNRYQRGSSGPLNTIALDHVRLYFSSAYSLISPALSELKISPQDTHTPTIEDKFSAIRFLKASQINNSHNLSIPAYRNDEALSYIQKSDNRLKIAISPFIGQRVTEFPMVKGTAKFTPKHSDEYIKTGVTSIRKIMNKALQSGCNIIVFPEFMIEDEMLQEIIAILSEGNYNELLFVVAGTRWTPENANELIVLDKHGEIMATCHKYAPFSEYRPNEQTGELVRMTENLRNPGDVLTLLDIKDIGRFSFAVCRDVSVTKGEVNALLSHIINVLQPDFLIVPAWSSSVEAGFVDQFRAFGERRTISILCNCCEPIAIGKHHASQTTRILLGSPCKDVPEKACVSGKTESRSCEEVFTNMCPHRDCLYIFEIDLSKQSFHTDSPLIVDSSCNHYFDL